MSMIFEISIFKLAKISSKILDTKKNLFFVELCNEKQTNQQTNNCSKSIKNTWIIFNDLSTANLKFLFY